MRRVLVDRIRALEDRVCKAKSVTDPRQYAELKEVEAELDKIVAENRRRKLLPFEEQLALLRADYEGYRLDVPARDPPRETGQVAWPPGLRERMYEISIRDIESRISERDGRVR